MTNITRHIVTHLLTFSLQNGEVQSVEEAQNRLSFLAQNKKLWSQQMYLDVGAGGIYLRDVQSQDELESYAFRSIFRCQAVNTEKHFPSLLMLVCQGDDQKKPDIHFFNCETVKAQQICDEVTLAVSTSTAGKSKLPPDDRYTNGGPDISFLRAEREVGILNHCFDEIEAFMGKLQQTAEAATVLNQRKKKKKKSKKQSAEDELLATKARPPPDGEFIDIFQKFKYCFSLLARLKSTITNPSSEDLIHHVFKPLDMLRGPVAPYTPVFFDGWKPEALKPDGQVWEDPVESQHKLEALREKQEQQPPQPPNDDTNSLPPGPDRLYCCSYDFIARNSSELSVQQGETLEVIESSKRWWKCRNRFNQVGFVPFNILEPMAHIDSPVHNKPPSVPAAPPLSKNVTLAPPTPPALPKTTPTHSPQRPRSLPSYNQHDARRATELEAVMEKQKMKVDLKLESSTL
ncbi:epidermal growth factor receptor kinase substrate 8-like protein 2 [Neolamprologus brichardi]|uniref:epidermal growth factor receptor kinase substrate 8-like protein 2 n=1 Tax=Neolamprologus brichardi TaxID=32507 RepID=UPI001643B0C2|nr:epidermal growth factor receptor kinase substrate 8-like protein 2 [Neolamprologus brichardi]